MPSRAAGTPIASAKRRLVPAARTSATILVRLAGNSLVMSVQRSGRLDGGWRLAPGGDRPATVLERLEAWSLRSPWLAVVAGVVVVAGLASVLLYLGPPVPRG